MIGGGGEGTVLCRTGGTDVGDQRQTAADRRAGTVAAAAGHHETPLRGEARPAPGAHPCHPGRTRQSPRRVNSPLTNIYSSFFRDFNLFFLSFLVFFF